MSSLTLALRNRISEVARLVEAVERFGRDHALPPDAVGQVAVVLDELVTNIISYGFPHGGEHEISVELRHDDGVFSAGISDDGIAYDPTAAPEPDLDARLEDRRVGGLGVHIARRFTDSISYERVDARNCLAITRRMT